jgi:hypothetical protein
MESYHDTLASLAPVCRYFGRHATREIFRCLQLDCVEHYGEEEAESGYHGTIERRRMDVRECEIRDGINTPQLPHLISRFANLRVLTLEDTTISSSLLKSIGRLQALEQLGMDDCHLYVNDEDPSAQTPVHAVHATPFPALRRATIGSITGVPPAAIMTTFCALVGTPTLEALAILDRDWLSWILLHVTTGLISLSGDFSRVSLDGFLQFIQGHHTLQNLAINCGKEDYSDLDLGKEDLPNLRSFSGPPNMAPKFVRSGLTRLALTPAAEFLPPWYGSGVFPMTTPRGFGDPWAITDRNKAWRQLKGIGEDIQELFVLFEYHGDALGPNLSLCFPHLVCLEIEGGPWAPSEVRSGYTLSC